MDKKWFLPPGWFCWLVQPTKTITILFFWWWKPTYIVVHKLIYRKKNIVGVFFGGKGGGAFLGHIIKSLAIIFKASALCADAFYKSKCLSVCLSVCVSVCSLLRYRLNVFLPPLPEVGCPIFLEIRNPWGKIMERSGLTLEHFCLEMV